MAKKYYEDGRRLSRAGKRFEGTVGYVARKVEHMQRMGTSAEVYGGAAMPTWRKNEIERAKGRR